MAFANTSLSNIDDNLKLSEKQEIRTKLGVAAKNLENLPHDIPENDKRVIRQKLGLVGLNEFEAFEDKLDHDLENLSDSLTDAQKAIIRNKIGASATQTALEAEFDAKADVDLQNISTTLTDAQKQIIRDRIGAISDDDVDTSGGGGGASSLVELSDTPSTLIGQGGMFAKVNTAETAVEFVDIVELDLPNISASKITTGTFDAARIPNIAASKVNSGTFDEARIPNLDAGKITTGTFDAARIPNLDAGKITTGTISADRIPDLAASKITSGEFDAARIPELGESKISDNAITLAKLATGTANTFIGFDSSGNAAEQEINPGTIVKAVTSFPSVDNVEETLIIFTADHTPSAGTRISAQDIDFSGRGSIEGLFIDDNNIYLADSSNDTIYIYNAETNAEVATIDVSSQTTNPRGITVDDSHIYVVGGTGIHAYHKTNYSHDSARSHDFGSTHGTVTGISHYGDDFYLTFGSNTETGVGFVSRSGDTFSSIIMFDFVVATDGILRGITANEQFIIALFEDGSDSNISVRARNLNGFAIENEALSFTLNSVNDNPTACAWHGDVLHVLDNTDNKAYAYDAVYSVRVENAAGTDIYGNDVDEGTIFTYNEGAWKYGGRVGDIPNRSIALSKFATGTPGKFIGYDDDGNAVELEQLTTSDQQVLANFVDLGDTPSSLADQGGEFVRVNSAGTNLEFATIAAADIPSLGTDKITTGTFDDARLPNFNASKINAGTFETDRIPDLDAGKITTGTFDAARIPNIDAGKITTGTIGNDRLSAIPITKIEDGTAGKVLGYNSLGNLAELDRVDNPIEFVTEFPDSPNTNDLVIFTETVRETVGGRVSASDIDFSSYSGYSSTAIGSVQGFTFSRMESGSFANHFYMVDTTNDVLQRFHDAGIFLQNRDLTVGSNYIYFPRGCYADSRGYIHIVNLKKIYSVALDGFHSDTFAADIFDFSSLNLGGDKGITAWENNYYVAFNKENSLNAVIAKLSKGADNNNFTYIENFEIEDFDIEGIAASRHYLYAIEELSGTFNVKVFDRYTYDELTDLNFTLTGSGFADGLDWLDGMLYVPHVGDGTVYAYAAPDPIRQGEMWKYDGTEWVFQLNINDMEDDFLTLSKLKYGTPGTVIGYGSSGQAAEQTLTSEPELIWEAGPTYTDQITSSGDTVYNLITGRRFSDYDDIAIMIQNGSNSGMGIQTIAVDLFDNDFDDGDVVPILLWTDISFMRLERVSDTSFKRPSGTSTLGLRKIYGVRRAHFG